MGLITVNSRKGGTGKTTVLLIIAIELSKEGDVCVIDFDTTGPSWAYLLGHLKLNLDAEDVLTLDKYLSPWDFDIKYNYLDYPRNVDLGGGETSFSVVVMRPTPGAINKTEDYLRSLSQLEILRTLDKFLTALFTKYKYILIDNSPGYVTHSILPNMLSYENVDDARIIVSSADVPDLAGILYEINTWIGERSDVKTFWIINKIPRTEKIRSIYGELVDKESDEVNIINSIMPTIIAHHPQMAQIENFKSVSIIEQIFEDPEKLFRTKFIGNMIEDKLVETYAFNKAYNGNIENFKEELSKPLSPLVDIELLNESGLYKNVKKNIVRFLI